MPVSRFLLSGLALGFSLSAHAAGFIRSNLVSDGSLPAAVIDPNLINPWGISYGPGGPFWVSDNNSGLVTLYNGAGANQGLVVTVPTGAHQTPPGAPTGQVFNGTSDFAVSLNGASGPAAFLFATENGTISGWNPNLSLNNAINAVDRSVLRAVYKGLALYGDSTGNYLLATNFRSGLVEVYDGKFGLVEAFRDLGGKGVAPIPNDYSPFNVAVLGGHIYVSYAKVDGSRHDNLNGPGTGFIDEVRINGTLVRRIVSHGPLDAPWGMAIAPSSWGQYAGTLLVGNFGNGWIDSFRLSDGAFQGLLPNASGAPVTIPGLWGLIVGDGGPGGSARKLYFSAGPSHETHGLFGSLRYVP